MKYLWAAIIFICGELISLVIFSLIQKYLGPLNDRKSKKLSTAKGILERLTLFIGLLQGFPQIIIAFSALKLGTRLHEEKELHISNTYFLVGNLTSILISMIYASTTKSIWF
ncbi:MAG: hypothetical protein MRK01_00745 [Candidatus Scalindua sp.]|nr:hypothetical protein [Candidatus Scalindua sp.]